MNYSKLPVHMVQGAKNYIEDGIPPGGFLTAVLENDLVGSFATADGVNQEAMFTWAEFLHNEAPIAAWGSREAVLRWIERGGLNGS